MKPVGVSGSPDGLGSVPATGTLVGIALVAGLLYYLSKK